MEVTPRPGDQTNRSRRFLPAKPMSPTKPIETDKNRQKPTLFTSKTDETDINRQKRRFLHRFRRSFSTRALLEMESSTMQLYLKSVLPLIS